MEEKACHNLSMKTGIFLLLYRMFLRIQNIRQEKRKNMLLNIYKKHNIFTIYDSHW